MNACYIVSSKGYSTVSICLGFVVKLVDFDLQGCQYWKKSLFLSMISCLKVGVSCSQSH